MTFFCASGAETAEVTLTAEFTLLAEGVLIFGDDSLTVEGVGGRECDSVFEETIGTTAPPIFAGALMEVEEVWVTVSSFTVDGSSVIVEENKEATMLPLFAGGLLEVLLLLTSFGTDDSSDTWPNRDNITLPLFAGGWGGELLLAMVVEATLGCIESSTAPSFLCSFLIFESTVDSSPRSEPEFVCPFVVTVVITLPPAFSAFPEVITDFRVPNTIVDGGCTLPFFKLNMLTMSNT